MDRIKVGIIGTGNISHLHVKSYMANPAVDVVAAADINQERAKDFCRQYSIPHVFGNHTDLLEANVDAVSICTWNQSHAEIAIDALRAGKHVLCEKPPAMNYAQALEMERTARAAGRLLMVGFVRRFGKNTTILKEFIDRGHLGDIYYAKAACLRRCGNPTGWFSDRSRSGGGPLIDLGVHMIDLCRFLMGGPRAISVYGATFDRIGPRIDVKMFNRYIPMDKSDQSDVEDFVSSMIRFENGAVLHVETSFTLHVPRDRISCEIFGTKAGAAIEPRLEIVSAMEGYNVDIIPRYSKDQDVFHGNFQREIDHFADCILRGMPCISPVEDGVEMMRILDGIYLSAKTRREVFLG